MFSREDEDYFGSNEFQIDINEINNRIEKVSRGHSGMDFTTVVSIVGCVVVLMLLLACCCSRKKYRGQVIATPAVVSVPVPPGPGVYPQQQYGPPSHQHYAVPVATSYPTQSANTSFPTAMPTPYAAPFPASHYPAAPYPAAAPYPTHVAPYPTATAPDAHALPPTYDQAVGAQKDPPYNPNVPH